MACVITDKGEEVRTKQVNGKPVKIYIQKATRKCSPVRDAITEEEPEEEEDMLSSEVITDGFVPNKVADHRVNDSLEDKLLSFNDEFMPELYHEYTGNYLEIWKDRVINSVK